MTQPNVPKIDIVFPPMKKCPACGTLNLDSRLMCWAWPCEFDFVTGRQYEEESSDESPKAESDADNT